MTDGHSPAPPPGWQPPAPPPYAAPPPGSYPPPPGYDAPPGGYPPPPPGYYAPPGYQAPPGYYAPAYQRPIYKPGTIPLRPLTVGDMFGAAIETIRRNPKATIGIAALVLTAFVALPVLGTLAWGLVEGLGTPLTTSSDAISPEDVGLLLTSGAGGLASAVGTIVLTGMLVHVVAAAARGEKMSAAASWRLARGRILRLFGLSLLSGLMAVGVVAIPIVVAIIVGIGAGTVAGVLTGLVLGAAGVCLAVFLWVRLVILAAPNLVLERRGVLDSMSRAWELSRGQFWRTFGIALLSALVASIAGNMLQFPLALVGGLASVIWEDKLAGLVVMVLANNVAVVLAGALTTPFTAAVSALQYVDQRIRKEGYDIELMSGLQQR